MQRVAANDECDSETLKKSRTRVREGGKEAREGRSSIGF